MAPSAEAKFLGIWIDQKRSFWRQAEYTLHKGTMWYLQFGCLARPKKGIKMQHVHTLYSIWIVPQCTIPGRRNTRL